MDQPIVVTTSSEAIYYILAWLSAVTGMVSFFRILFYCARYYISAGDEEKLRSARWGLLMTVVLLFVSVLIGLLAYNLGKEFS